MQTAEIKLEIFRYIDSLEESKLSQIYDLLFLKLQNQQVDFWDTLNEWQKNDIELGLADLEKGDKKEFDDFILKH